MSLNYHNMLNKPFKVNYCVKIFEDILLSLKNSPESEKICIFISETVAKDTYKVDIVNIVDEEDV